MNFQEHTVCPITGLPIFQKKEWADLVLASDYSVSFRIINKLILQSQCQGNMASYDALTFFQLRQKVIDEAFGENVRFIEIKGYKELYGIPPKKTRNLQTEYLRKERTRQEVVKIERKNIEENTFIIPNDFKCFDH